MTLKVGIVPLSPSVATPQEDSLAMFKMIYKDCVFSMEKKITCINKEDAHKWNAWKLQVGNEIYENYR